MAKIETEYTSSDTYSDYELQTKDSVFGGEDDLWGASDITVSQLKDPSFKIKFDAELGLGTLRADQVEVEIFYADNFPAVQNAPEEDLYATDTAYTEDDIVWALASDGTAHLYTAIGTGNSGSVQPIFPVVSGDTVIDGDITWVESGEYYPVSFPPYQSSFLQAGAIGRAADGSRLFVVVGEKGIIKTSSDGEIWTERESGVGTTLRGVAAGAGGRFAAVGDNGTIITSENGIVWAKENSGINESLFSVDFDLTGNNFIAAGRSGIVRKEVGNRWVASRN